VVYPLSASSATTSWWKTLVCQCCVTPAWFVAVGDLGDDLMLKARKSDQLIVEGVVLKQHWTDQNKKTEANQRIEWTPTIQSPQTLTDEQMAILVAVVLEEFGAGLTRAQFDEIDDQAAQTPR
jgi:hypothetical protein